MTITDSVYVIAGSISGFLGSYGFSMDEFRSSSTTLTVYIIGILVYSIFIFKFYKLVSKRDIIDVDLHKYDYSKHEFVKKVSIFLLSTVLYFIVFPLIAFFGFLVISSLLALLSRDRTVESIMILSMAFIGAVRALSYYSEGLAQDLSKLLPFALLGVLLIDASIISIGGAFSKMISVFEVWRTLVYYFVFIVIVEFIMSMTYKLYYIIKPVRTAEKR